MSDKEWFVVRWDYLVTDQSILWEHNVPYFVSRIQFQNKKIAITKILMLTFN